MSKFNKPKQITQTAKKHARSPLVAEKQPTGVTYEGGAGYKSTPQAELFKTAVNNLVGERTFYESPEDRDERFEQLVREVAVAEPAWMQGFVPWLRGSANMRSASVVAAAQGAHAMLAAGVPGGRALIRGALQRADEPGELLAYWTARFGSTLPKPVAKGLADACNALYTEYSLLKYDTHRAGKRFADVLSLARPVPRAPWQDKLYKFAHWRAAQARNREYVHVDIAGAELISGVHAAERSYAVAQNGALPMVAAQLDWYARARERDASLLTDAAALKAAGLTWEDVLSVAGKLDTKPDMAAVWAALHPQMGYMALLRNLRAMDEAGLPDEQAALIAARLADPDQVARSRQFPFRFLAAYREVQSNRWGHALDKALQASLANVPQLPGRTLILVDTSGSMGMPVSDRSSMKLVYVAAVFGVALAMRSADVSLYGFADPTPFKHEVPTGKVASYLKVVDAFTARIGEAGHGTAIAGSVAATYQGHDRVVIISDMQTRDGRIDQVVPAHVPVYGFNLGGYKYGAMPSGGDNRHEFGGLTDATFRFLPLLEAGRNAAWPWEQLA